jgi:hypothetical protein
MTWGSVELESDHIDLLALRGPLLDEPYTRQLHGKLRELRFYVDGNPVRITYWISSGRRIILLTTFRKTKMRERHEVQRAVAAMDRCLREAHTTAEEGEG